MLDKNMLLKNQSDRKLKQCLVWQHIWDENIRSKIDKLAKKIHKKLKTNKQISKNKEIKMKTTDTIFTFKVTLRRI